MIEKPKRRPHNPSCLQFFRFLGCVLLVPLALFILLGTYIFLILVIFTLSPPKVLDNCEKFITGTNGFRIRELSGGLRSTMLEYQATVDSGQSWVTFHEEHPVSAGWGDCEEDFYVVSDKNFYFLFPITSTVNTTFFITHDAGATWHEWSPDDIQEYPEGFRCGTIEEVHFTDTTYGTMQVGCSRFGDDGKYIGWRLLNLFTDDGGITWELAWE